MAERELAQLMENVQISRNKNSINKYINIIKHARTHVHSARPTHPRNTILHEKNTLYFIFYF